MAEISLITDKQQYIVLYTCIIWHIKQNILCDYFFKKAHAITTCNRPFFQGVDLTQRPSVKAANINKD